MNDELVKRLRDAAKMSEALAVLLPHSEGNATAKLYNEAADAIDELSREKESLAKTVQEASEALRKRRPVVRGKWAVSRTDYGWNCSEFPTHCKCTECGREVPYQDKDNFCPNCGAEMKGEAE